MAEIESNSPVGVSVKFRGAAWGEGKAPGLEAAQPRCRTLPPILRSHWSGTHLASPSLVETRSEMCNSTATIAVGLHTWFLAVIG